MVSSIGGGQPYDAMIGRGLAMLKQGRAQMSNGESRLQQISDSLGGDGKGAEGGLKSVLRSFVHTLGLSDWG
jgi:hypothetical protein